MAELRTTDIEAINTMMSCVGDAPINTLSGDLTANVQIAVNLLHDTSRAVQTRGWNFNTEDDYELSIDGNGKVPLPPNTLDIDLTTENGEVDVIQRGDFLYDKKAHSFTFTSNPFCSIIFFLAWEDLNEPARNYIKIKAARVFQDQTIGSIEHHRFSQEDEAAAQDLLAQSDARNETANIFQSPDMAGIVNRRRPRLSSFPS